MARKSDTLTPRQRQSQRIMREKAALKKRKELLRKLQIAGGALSLVAAFGGGFWVWHNSIISRTVEATVTGGYKMTTDAGFSLQNIYLEGRSRTSIADIDKALGVKRGDPILQLSLDEVRARLEAIESVKTAAVERALPGTLYVRIVEREPVALWQNQGKIALVDDNGAVMSDIDSAPYQNLPLIVGADAPKHIAELLTLLSAEPSLQKRFMAAVRVGERRWNIRLESGAEVKLPEKNPEAAWKKLAELQSKQQLLDRDVRVIDLRIDGRLFIKLSPEELPSKAATNAKET